MPMMDMSAALTNPYTLDVISVVRRTLTNNEYGEANTSDATTPGVFAVVTPADSTKLSREDATQSVAKTIDVITKFALYTASGPYSVQGFQADLVIWNGVKYLVESIEDYSKYGPGFIFARATAITRAQLPPVTEPLQ